MEAFSSEVVPPLGGTWPALATSPAGTRTVRQSADATHSHVASNDHTTPGASHNTALWIPHRALRTPRRVYFFDGVSSRTGVCSGMAPFDSVPQVNPKGRSRGDLLMAEHATVTMLVQHCSARTLSNDAATRAQERRGGAVGWLPAALVEDAVNKWSCFRAFVYERYDMISGSLGCFCRHKIPVG